MTTHETYLALLRTYSSFDNRGAVMVVTEDNTISVISSHYHNPYPFDLEQDLIPTAIATAAKWSGKCKNATLYTTEYPIRQESKMIIASGISMVVLDHKRIPAVVDGLDLLYRAEIPVIRFVDGKLETYMRCIKCSNPNFYQGHVYYCQDCFSNKGPFCIFGSDCSSAGQCQDYTNFISMTRRETC